MLRERERVQWKGKGGMSQEKKEYERVWNNCPY